MESGGSGGYSAAEAPDAAATADGSKKVTKKEKKAAPVPVPAGPPPDEKTPEELAKMSKEERTQYHAARRAAATAAGAKTGAAAGPALSNAERKAAARALQEAQRKAKEEKANVGKEGDALIAELKLQGLSEDQARLVAAEMSTGIAAADEVEDDDEELDTLHGSVRVWMREQEPGTIPEDAVRDFNMKVRFQGHVDSTPPDHLGAILTVLLEEALGACDLKADKIQPGAVAKALTQSAERWVNLLRGLYSKISDVLEGVGVVIAAITESLSSHDAPESSKECAMVGCLMAMRDLDDFIEDEDLLVGCRGIEPKSKVLEKYIAFLEEAVEEDDESDEE